MVRIEPKQRELLTELAARIQIQEGKHCSMTKALKLLLEHLEGEYTAKQLAEAILQEHSHID